MTLAETLEPYVATTVPHTCPTWATECLTDPEEIGIYRHGRRPATPVTRVPLLEDHPPREVDVEVYQCEAPGTEYAHLGDREPSVFVMDEQFKLAQARTLALALLELVAIAEASR